MDEEEASSTRLRLGIGTGTAGSKQKPAVQLRMLFPTHSERNHIGNEDDGSSSKVNHEGDDHDTNDDERGKCNARKKLLLSKEQSSILEDVFKERDSLTQKEKQELAKKVNLQPRQVEVWFQNRRARTKSRQVEMDCEFFKKCCESLTAENLLLKNELQELVKVLKMCPLCRRVAMEKEAAMEGSSMTS